MKKIGLVMAFLTLGTVALFAQTGSYVLPYDKFNYLHSAETAIPPKHLHPRISLHYWYYSASEYFDTSGHAVDLHGTYSQNWIIPAISFGAGDVAEFGFAVPFVMENVEYESSDLGTSDGSGLGDMMIWVKAAVTKNPWFGFRFAAKLATGNSDPGENELQTGTGQTDLDMGFQFSHKPEKMGLLFDFNIAYRLRLEWEGEGVKIDPGDEGRLGLYIGGKPIEGFGILFGGDGFISFNDKLEGYGEVKKSYRASSLIGIKMIYDTPFGLGFDGGIKMDIAGKDAFSGFGFTLGASYQPEF